MKKNIEREQAKISTIKANMQATIAGIHTQENFIYVTACYHQQISVTAQKYCVHAA